MENGRKKSGNKYKHRAGLRGKFISNPYIKLPLNRIPKPKPKSDGKSTI